MPERAQPAASGLGFHQNSGGTGDRRLHQTLKDALCPGRGANAFAEKRRACSDVRARKRRRSSVFKGWQVGEVEEKNRWEIASGRRFSIRSLADETEIRQRNGPGTLPHHWTVGRTGIRQGDVAGRHACGNAARSTLPNGNDLHGKGGTEQPQHGKEPAGLHALAATQEVHRGHYPFFSTGCRRDEIQPDCFSLAKEHGRIRACGALNTIPRRKSQIRLGSSPFQAVTPTVFA